MFLMQYEGLIPDGLEVGTILGGLLLCALCSWRFLVCRTLLAMFIYGVCLMAQDSSLLKIPVLSQTAEQLFYLGPNTMRLVTIGFACSALLLTFFLKSKRSRLVLAGILLLVFIFYDKVYNLNLFGSLGFIVSFAVISESIPDQNPRYEGIWAFLLAMVVFMSVAVGNHYLPYEKVRNQAVELLPDSWVRSTANHEEKALGGPIYNQSSEPLLRVQAQEVPLYMRSAVYHVYDGQRWRMGDSYKKEENQLQKVDSTKDYYFSYKGTKPTTRIPFGPLGMKSESLNDVFYYSGIDLEKPLNEDRDSNQIPELKTYLGDIIKPNMSDLEKVEAIQQKLKRHGTYTLNAKSPPKDRDFVSYFLFDNPQGYCTYYATSMVILAREVGVPARYVEGFVTNPLKVERGEFIITEQESHAWAEVYIEGTGWKTIETTPLESLTTRNISDENSTKWQEEQNELVKMDREKDSSVKSIEGNASGKRNRIGILLMGLSQMTLVIFLLNWITGRMLYQRKEKWAARRCCAYLDQLILNDLGQPSLVASPSRHVELWCREDASGVANQFDGIIKVIERVLYGKEVDRVHEFSQIVAFTKAVENQQGTLIKRLWLRLIFLKGWHYD